MRQVIAILAIIIALVVAMAGIISTVLVDAHHWWPGKRKKQI